MKNQKKYYLGLDIGTDSVGYAVTDEQYKLLKFHGEDAWGAHIFDAASLNDERRAFRTARRRLDRRQQRVALIQELFASEIAKIDPRFFIRIQESYLFREDCQDKYILFNDDNYTDVDYYKQYPTIHHLLNELMISDKPHDVRMIYIACAWLVAHRGHFLSNVNKNNISAIKDFKTVYSEFIQFFNDNEYKSPWGEVDIDMLGSILKKKSGVTTKAKELTELLLNGQKAAKLSKDEEIDESFPFSLEGIIKLLAGGTYALKDFFGKEEYADLETKSISLGMDEEKFMSVMADLGDDFEIISAMRKVYDWAVLADALGNEDSISAAKVKVYEQHKDDLKFLKYIVDKYLQEKDSNDKRIKAGKSKLSLYDEIFRDTTKKGNYASYVKHSDEPDLSKFKNCGKEDFSKYILSLIKDITPDDVDFEKFNDMKSRLENRTFMPKQKDTDNRVIPHQLYWYELDCILKNAISYLPFLNEKDEKGVSVFEKIESVFLFRVPYFVGPLNKKSSFAWIERKAGRIYPWNFNEMVDLDASEEEFIKRMTCFCTYLPGEKVLPKDSLAYHKFTVLNEINNLRINGERISVELKQKIYNEVFLQKKKVTRKYLTSWLLQNNIISKNEVDGISGIDEEIKSNLIPQIAFNRLISSGILSENDVERIIERASYAEDKSRLSKWIAKEYPSVSEADRKYICSVKIKDFGRLSRRFLCELEGIDKSTGEVVTVLSAMWNSQNNLMEIIADEEKYTFAQVISDFRKEYYSEKKMTLEKRLDDMYLSNAVRRPVYRTLDIVKDVKKAFGEPAKIFVEMARGGTPEQKGKRTKSRKDQILELYKQCRDEDVRLLNQQLIDMGDAAETKLQSEKLFLYYMQLGKCMYSGKSIDISQLVSQAGNNAYCDIDHIYPQAYVKDDSIINNKVLVFSELNGQKGDTYPIADKIRHGMHSYWTMLKNAGLISEEKYKRLTRATPFTAEEKYGFINRQITETTQSTKAVATLLKEYFPNAEIVYSKARLTSEFRQEFGLFKSRTFNDLHHAVDAYLNIVTGNVYNSKFTKNFYIDKPYSIKTSTVFTHPVMLGNTVVWDGTNMLDRVKKTASKNTAHFTKYSFFKKGGFFDQTIYPASEGLERIKKNMPTEKYGGYSGLSTAYLLLIKYRIGKKEDVMFFPVPVLFTSHFESDNNYAINYISKVLSESNNKAVSDVSILLNGRKIKISSILSLDGFRVILAGASLKDGRARLHVATQYSASLDDMYYLKKLEMLVKKSGENKNYIYDAEYDKVSCNDNIKLYLHYIDKLNNSIYSKRPGNGKISEELDKALSIFKSLTPVEQAKTLLQIHSLFCRTSNSGVDLTGLKLSSSSCFPRKSLLLSGWKKDYKDVRIIDTSASGLWEKNSENLLDLL